MNLTFHLRRRCTPGTVVRANLQLQRGWLISYIKFVLVIICMLQIFKFYIWKLKPYMIFSVSNSTYVKFIHILNELGQTGKQQTERVKKIGTGGIRTSAHSLVSSNELSNCATRVYSGRLVNLTVTTLHSLECLSDQLYYII